MTEGITMNSSTSTAIRRTLAAVAVAGALTVTAACGSQAGPQSGAGQQPATSPSAGPIQAQYSGRPTPDALP
jgi:hypothetical protein